MDYKEWKKKYYKGSKYYYYNRKPKTEKCEVCGCKLKKLSRLKNKECPLCKTESRAFEREYKKFNLQLRTKEVNHRIYGIDNYYNTFI